MNKKYVIIVEIVWAIIGLACLAISAREFLNNGKQAWIFLVMTVFSFTLAGLREYQRKKL
jgi:hypothetical protein